MFSKIVDFLGRYGLTIVIGFLALWILQPAMPEQNTILLIVTFEMLALLLSGLAGFVLFSFGRYKYLAEGDDKKMNSIERHAVLEFKGKVFVAVHILVGLSIVGFYLAQIG